ncbi:hypothetical protein [Anaeroselena agilis]|uniref:N-acetyltransferase domain-containing protein n=1 Tax=Anaeroselena agilis TaxID=3063788 RepID=A0ABU3P3K1_9FIRM|nr:hypothetical protein [Selenomonadales bacterium 4137-cl]
MSESSFRLVPIDEANAGLVGEVFRAAYGDAFPVKYVYRPEAVLEEIRHNRLAALLAVDEDNRAAGYVSVFKSSPNPRLWEAGNMVVVPAYKQTDVSMLLAAAYTDGTLFAGNASDGLFGEVVCCHYFTQVSGIKAGQVDCALELDQLDGPSFKDNRTGSARVSCVLNFKEYSRPTGPVYLPPVYGDFLSRLAQPLQPRTFAPATAPLPQDGLTRHEDRYYEAAQTWKVAVSEIGADWARFTAKLLAEAKRRGVVSLQLTLNAGCPAIGAAVEELRASGFFFGGLAPRWFGSDGLLMQQVLGVETEYEHIRLYSPTAKELLAFIRADRASVTAGAGN